MKLDRYITFQNKGQYYILQSASPHYIGEVLRFESDAALISVDNSRRVAYCQVTGYRIVIGFAGAIAGNHILFHAEWKEELNLVFGDMALFYLTDRINGNEGKFKKYVIE